MEQQPDLAAMVSSRICHDLVSPVGAIVNGIDLVREIAGADCSAEIGMISETADRAAGLLKFYRIAFGAVDSAAPHVGRKALLEQAGVLVGPPRVTLEWDTQDGQSMPRSHAKLLSLLLLCGRSVIGMRGAIRVLVGHESAFPMRVEINLNSAARNPEVLDILDSGRSPPALTPREVEFALAADLASRLGTVIAVERGETVVSITARARG